MPITRTQQTGPELSIPMAVARYRVALENASLGECAPGHNACDDDGGALLAGEHNGPSLDRETELLLESGPIDVFHPPPHDWLPEGERDGNSECGEQRAEQSEPLETGFNELTTPVGHASLGNGSAQHCAKLRSATQ
jgi:hypothetical protein